MCSAAYVYILTNRRDGTLYVGVTTDLMRRMHEHRNHLAAGFTQKYNATKLVWYLAGESIVEALALEKKIKNRNRDWKIRLIEGENPDWQDLSAGWR